MKSGKILQDDLLLQKATSTLVEEFGAVNALRVFSLLRGRATDSVKRHRKWQQSLDAETFFDEAFAKQDKKSTR